MTSNLAHPPIATRSGKHKTVHESSIAERPIPASSENASSASLFPHLRTLTVPDVTALYDAGLVYGVESLGQAYREIMNLFKHFSEKGVLGPHALGSLLEHMEDRYKSDEKGIRVRQGSAAEQHGRNIMLVIEYLQTVRPMTDAEMRGIKFVENVSIALEGCYRTNTDPNLPFALSSPKQVQETAAVCAYMSRIIEAEGGYFSAQDSSHLFFQNRLGLRSGRVPAVHKKSTTIEEYVRSNPELSYRIADFVHARKIGNTKAEAQHVIDYFSEKSAVMEGWL